MNYILSLIVITIMNFNWLYAQDKTTIIYIGDPMCSWCYGFAPEISKVKGNYPAFDFKIVLGGLRPNGTEQINGMKDFLKEHWEHVNEASKQPFKYDVLDEKDFVYDTEPACRAVMVAREMKPNIEMDFFKNVQTAFYADNKNTNNITTYVQLARTHGLDEAKFKSLFESEEIKQKVKEDFVLASNMGVSGFPAVIISKNGELHLVCKGYMKAEQLIKNIDKITK